jgi:hydrogenase maturation protease
MKRVRPCVVLGLGNPLRGDDGVGLAVAEAFSRLLERQPIEGVRVATSERGGLDVLPLIEGAETVVVVDCLEVEAPAAAGQIRWLTKEDLRTSPRLRGAHDLALPGVLKLGEALGMKMPRSVEVLGIQAAPGPEITDRLSPPLAARVERLAERLHDHLARAASRSQAQG